MIDPPRPDWAFKRDTIRCFHFSRREFDPASGEIRLGYRFDDSPECIERLSIPGAPFALAENLQPALGRALLLLHLIAGISYYKAAVPPEIIIESGPLDADTAALLTLVYEKGLGEFAYRNNLSLRGKIRFPVAAPSFDPVPPPKPDPQPANFAALVAIGGGKDSLVSIEWLRAAGIEPTVCWIGHSRLIAACAGHTGLPLLNISRALAPELFAFNRAGAWNGHIPVTAINSAILVFAALLTGRRQVVFSNERSASYGSEIPGAGEINHQWSKGWEFEQAFSAYVHRRIAPHLDYFSLLRPWSELAVAERFAHISRYDAHFSSCNRNFHLLGERPANRWCGDCPKCRFVFLALAPFMSKPRLLRIFGDNLMDRTAHIAGFDALIEYRDHKPLECVGEARESRAAFAALAARPEWREDALVARFTKEIAPQMNKDELRLQPLLTAAGEHGIPLDLWNRLNDAAGA